MHYCINCGEEHGPHAKKCPKCRMCLKCNDHGIIVVDGGGSVVTTERCKTCNGTKRRNN